MMNREWSRAEIEDAAPWLKRMNAKGNDVYIRPAGEHGFVLVDDVKPDALARMRADGLSPAVTIETSPGNFQAWVKLAGQPLPADVRTVVARLLAKRYGGDPNSADARHYGRLAGFTNQKPAYTRDGRQPYVLAHDCFDMAAPKGLELARSVSEALDRGMAGVEREKRLAALKTALPGDYSTRHDPVREYQRQARRLIERYGKDADLSRMDWMIAIDMAQSGRFTQADIERGIATASPNVESRKVGHMEDYARRTAAKAWNAPEVQEQRQERARHVRRDRDRGMSR